MVEPEDRPPLEGMDDPSEGRREFINPKWKARGYQLEVLERALDENTIIFMETGCGKTLIAVLLIEALSHLIRRPSRKVAVFLVPNRALVEQQALEIEEHTDLRIGRYCGSMGVSHSFSKAWWQQQLVQYEVIVMTPQILFTNLHHCFLKMEMIELLIFDECHHAQKRHPYAHIMRDFYHGKAHIRPKIFGLTASPVIGKVDGCDIPGKMDSQIQKLEKMLDSRLYTLKDRNELESLLPNPYEHIRRYQPSYTNDNVKKLSGMLQALRSKYTNSLGVDAIHCESMMTKLKTELVMKKMDEISKVYHKLDYCIYELGIWCTIKAVEMLQSKDGQSLGSEATDKLTKEAFLREALSMLKAAHSTDATMTGAVQDIDDRQEIDEALVSSKLLCLVQAIIENRENFTKCIIFVDRVVATSALSSFLNCLKCLSFVRCLPLVGCQGMSQKTQEQALVKFRTDEVNLLVATNIAEEGLDIQSCSMVIRFDGVPKTTRSFIQSRGRARQKGSNYIILLESGNQDQLKDVSQLKVKERLMWELTANRRDMPAVLGEPETYDAEIFRVERTGAVVTTDYSVPLLHRYCSKLPADEFYRPAPVFSYFCAPEGGFICEVQLPVTSPFRLVSGHPCRTEKMAKRVASLEACKKLHEVGALTDYLLPASELDDVDMAESEVPGEENLPTDPMAQMELHPTMGPEAFQGSWAVASAKVCLFAYAFHIVAEPRDREYAEFALFLEVELDQNTKSTITEMYLTKGRILKVQLVPQGQLEFDVHQLRSAQKFQERIFSITLGAEMKSPSNLSLPTSTHWDPSRLYLTLPLAPSIKSPVAVDWKCVQDVLSEPVFESRPESQSEMDNHGEDESSLPASGNRLDTPDFFQMLDGQVPVEAVINSLVETSYNGKLYFVVDVLWEMDGNSPFTCDKRYSTYVDYYRKKHKVDFLYPKQKLLKAKPCMKMHNLLAKRPGNEAGLAGKVEMLVELVPELCSLKVLGFATGVNNTVSLIPSLMYRIEYLLLATQLRKKLEAGFSEAARVSHLTVLQAMTTAKCLEDFSLERLELFGDSFLKFAVSKRLFLVDDTKQEGELTKMRQSAICNSSLHERGVEHDLTMYIHDELFNPQHWSAPGRPCRAKCDASNPAARHALQDGTDASASNQIKCSEGHRWLQKKAVADVVEALIGAHLVDGGPDAALAFMEWVGINVYFNTSLIAEASLRCSNDNRSIEGKELLKLEKILGYKFHNKALLLEALTHPSYQVPLGNCYQRLEFLGDAVLDFLITSHLYANFPDLDPGLLTDLRSATASNECFARVAVSYNLEEFLLHDSPILAEQVENFVRFIKNASKGREKFYRWECNKGPKVLGDLVESLAGAVLVDTGFDTSIVWSVFEPLLQPIVTPDTLHLHPVRELVELCNIFKFALDCKSTSDKIRRSVTYTVNTGQGKLVATAEKGDKKSAERQAAYDILEKLKDLGWQHPYQKLTDTLISQCKLEPFVGVVERSSMKNKSETLFNRHMQVALNQGAAENRTISANRDLLQCSIGNRSPALPEEAINASVSGIQMPYRREDSIQSSDEEDLDDRDLLQCSVGNGSPALPEEAINASVSGIQMPYRREDSIQSSDDEDLDDASSGEFPEIVSEAAIENKELDPSECLAAHPDNPPRSLPVELLQGDPSAGRKDLCLASAKGRDHQEALCSALGDPRNGNNARSIEALLTQVLKFGNMSWLREAPAREVSDVAGRKEVNNQGLRQSFTNVEEADLETTSYAVESEINVEIPCYDRCPYDRSSEAISTDRSNLQTHKRKHRQHAGYQDYSEDGIDGVNSEFQFLIDVLVNGTVRRHLPHVDSSSEPKERDLEERICRKGGVKSPNEFLKPDHITRLAASEERPSECRLKNSSFDENVGRPRDDLHKLCAKYKWKTPNFTPCPGYPQGPAHAPRFAFIVNISCFLSHRGQTCVYDVECEGEPMNVSKRAMDSAASCAMTWLQKRSEEGMLFAQSQGFH